MGIHLKFWTLLLPVTWQRGGVGWGWGGPLTSLGQEELAEGRKGKKQLSQKPSEGEVSLDL